MKNIGIKTENLYKLNSFCSEHFDLHCGIYTRVSLLLRAVLYKGTLHINTMNILYCTARQEDSSVTGTQTVSLMDKCKKIM